jgi:hypothetical protein
MSPFVLVLINRLSQDECELELPFALRNDGPMKAVIAVI